MERKIEYKGKISKKELQEFLNIFTNSPFFAKCYCKISTIGKNSDFYKKDVAERLVKIVGYFDEKIDFNLFEEENSLSKFKDQFKES